MYSLVLKNCSMLIGGLCGGNVLKRWLRNNQHFLILETTPNAENYLHLGSAIFITNLFKIVNFKLRMRLDNS